MLGIVLGHYMDFGPYFSIIFLSIGFMALLVSFVKTGSKGHFLFGPFAALTTISIGILSLSVSQPKNLLDHYSNFNVDDTHMWHIKVREVLKPNHFSDRYMASVTGLDSIGVSGRLILNVKVDSAHKKFQVDDELVVYSTVEDIKPPLNPHQFNYKKYMEGLGVYHQVYLNAQNYYAKEHPSKTVYGIAANIRNKIIAKLRKANFGEEELGIIQALLLGQRNDISEETYDNYKNAGAVHILAVSGLHIGIILLLLQFLLGPMERLPHGKTLKLIGIVGLLWGFALLAGLSASIIRAVTMFSFVAYAMYLNRPTNTFNILALSMFFTLLIKPMLLFQVGFQMSYAAVFAIVWVYPLLQKIWFPKIWMLQKGWQLVSVSIAAQLGVLPIALYYFHQFPGLFFISNLLVVPFLGIILGMGVLVITLALLNGLPEFLASFYNTLIHGMNLVIGWVAQQEAFIFKDISFGAVQLVLVYFIIISLGLAFTKISYKRVLAFLWGIIGLQLWSFQTMYRTQHKEEILVAHQSRNSVLFHQTGNKLNVLTANKPLIEKITTNYKVAERIDEVEYLPLKNAYRLHEKKLFVMDSLGVYPTDSPKPEYVLLTWSPKINLERFIDSIGPKMIIADGSNYKSDIYRWKNTCTQKKVPFHYTGEKGAFILELK